MRKAIARKVSIQENRWRRIQRVNLNTKTNEIVLTKTSLSLPHTNPFSEALFGVDNVVLFCYVQSRPFAVVEIQHGGYKRLGRRDKSRRPLDMRSS